MPLKSIAPELLARWRSKKHVGAAAPTMRVTVERGLIDKTYQPFEFLGGGTQKPYEVSGGNNAEPWQGFWRSTDEHGPEGRDLPNVLSVVWDIGFAQKGAKTATIEVENIIYKLIAGAGGLYHQIIRGYLSPTLGADLIGRLKAFGAAQNEWYETLNNGYKVTVWEGYGDQMTKTFCGLIDSCDIETHPERITISARSFLMLLTDQRMMGWNKPPEITAPTTFSDKKYALNPKNKISHRHWVLVHDPAAVVKAILVWAGFHEWVVENVGDRLRLPLSFHMDKFLIDVVDEILKGGNLVFYEQTPSASAESLGVPVFEHNKAMDRPPAAGLLQITDADMLEAVQPKFDLSNLPYIIRARGNIDHDGVSYDEDIVKRFMGTYFPPWSGAEKDESGGFVEAGRVSGVRRHDYSVNPALTSEAECKVAAILQAVEYALEAYTASFQIAGLPGLELNEQLSVISNVTGINSRLWVSTIHSEHTAGKDGKWHMTVGGALLDTFDLQRIRKDLRQAEEAAAA